jgi:hypothetical protein
MNTPDSEPSTQVLWRRKMNDPDIQALVERLDEGANLEGQSQK